jgi:CheY-like chemotaxis protein
MDSMTMRTVLFVDDDPDVLALAKEWLSAQGYRVLEAEGAFQALDLLRESRPDAMVLDLMMPDRTGVEVLEEVRFDPQLADLPVICFSAVPQTEETLAFIREFSIGLVDKTDWPELMRRLATLFEGSRN